MNWATTIRNTAIEFWFGKETTGRTKMRHRNLLRKDDALLVIIDIQTKLLKVIFERERLVSSCRKLIQAARLLEVPMVMTEQYPKGMGPTDPEISQLIANPEAIEKVSFSCCGMEDFNHRIAGFGKKQILVIGIEAHVCVLQTVHDLLHQGYFVHVPYDAVSSRKEGDYTNALDRMRQAGAVVGSVESAVFELLEKAGTPIFRQVSKLIK
jgi:nicotinamidase-related amidase